jgi:ubiquinone/menaquinone biosynthesis C-methylase UbiE
MHQTDVADPVKWYYHPATGWFYRYRMTMALNMLTRPRYDCLLDIGFGSGIFLPTLAARCKELHGIDVHDNISLVEQMMRNEGQHATLQHASATQIPYPDDSFDCVVCMSVLEHIHELADAIREICRVTQEHGTIILGFPVENTFTHLLLQTLYLWLPNAKLDEEHVNTHHDILREIQQQLTVQKTVQFPSWIPLNYSLYYVCQCQTMSQKS